MNENQIHFAIGLFTFLVTNILLLVFGGRFENDKVENSIIVTVFDNSFHIHHWMIGLLILIVLLIVEQFTYKMYGLSFLKGIAFGLIFHGIVYYSDYFKIIK